jgi:CHAT domain-containing protein/tetratricopeptide (TPR) repeat protein
MNPWLIAVAVFFSCLYLLALALHHYRHFLSRRVEQLRTRGEYAPALRLARRWLWLSRWIAGPDRSSWTGSPHEDDRTSLERGCTGPLSVIPELLRENGLFDEAEQQLRESLEYVHVIGAGGTKGHAVLLHTLAGIHLQRGAVAAARPILEQALAIHHCAAARTPAKQPASSRNEARQKLEQVLGPLQVANVLSSLARVYQALGDHPAAVRAYQDALARYATYPSKTVGNTDIALNNLGSLYLEMGDLDRAGETLRRAIEHCRAKQGDQHPLYATAILNLALWHEKRGRFAESLRLIRECLDIRGKVLGTTSGEYLGALNNLACNLRMTGDYAAARTFIEQAQAARTVCGEDHPLHTTVLISRALIAVGEGKPADALALLRESAAIEQRVLARIFSVASDAQRLTYLDKIRERLAFVLSLVRTHLPDDPAATAEAYDRVLCRKALAAESIAVQRDAVLGRRRYPHLARSLDELSALRQQIAARTLAGPGEEGLDAHRRLLAEWQQRQEALEVALARAVPEMELRQRLLAADHRTVASALPAGSALVELVRFAMFDFLAVPARGEDKWKPARYLAFVLRPQMPDAVRMVDLGEVEEIDRLVWAFRTDLLGDDISPARGMTRIDEESAAMERSSASALRARIFDPLRDLIAGARHLILAPDGELALVPFEVLPDSTRAPLVEEFLFSYLAVGRDVLRSEERRRQAGDPLVVAAPDFDLEPAGQTEAGLVPRLCQPCETDHCRDSELPPTADTAVAQSDPTMTRRPSPPASLSRDLPRASLRFDPLPGTQAEGWDVARLLGVEPVLGPAAVESWVKKAYSPRVLHLATHGFFLPDQREIPEGGFRGMAPENPLLRSGLVLAGANTWLAGRSPPEEAEDGLLTAEDVTGLDLLGTELVVLSACETGLGQVRAGEGVFGLRRAFQLAGARTVVMSLWKVADEPTRELMGAFYRHLLAGVPRGEALRQAQLALKARYPDPRDWGAFICQGDYRPLGGVECVPG